MIDRMTGTDTKETTRQIALNAQEAQRGLDRLTAIAAEIQIAEAMLEAEAESLVEQFRNSRSKLRDEEKLQREAATEPAKGSLYSPLNISVRAHKGSMELYWFTQNKGKGERSAFKYIPQGRSGRGGGHGYHLTTLLAHARPYEREIVREAEREATSIRQRRAELLDIRRSVQRLIRRYEERIQGVPEAVPADDAPGLVPMTEAR